MFTRWQPRLILGIALVFTLGADEPSPTAKQNRRVACGQSETFEEKATAGQTGAFTIEACDCGPGTVDCVGGQCTTVNVQSCFPQFDAGVAGP